MDDFPTGGGSSNGRGGGGGGGWFRGYIQRSRSPTRPSGGMAAYDGGNGEDAPPSLSTPANIQGEFFSPPREQEWEQLDRDREREREQKAQKRTDEHHDHGLFHSSPNKQPKSTHPRHGITLPQRVSSLLNLSTTGSGAGAGGESKDKTSSPFKSFVPSGIDPRTPTEDYGQIPATASAAGPVYPPQAKGRKKSSFLFSTGEGDGDAEENDPDPFGYRRFPKVGHGSQAVGAWYNPNLMQIVESLQSAMMNKRDPMEHIPVVYNSYVLTLIEGFGKLTTQLKDLESEMAELKNLREKELEQFRGISEEWIQREDAYKAEIKRLELVLAKESKDGVASVAVARQTSLVDRSGTKRFQARLKRMSGSYQDGIMEQPLAEEEETATFDPNPASFPTLGEMPRRMDPSQDVLASRMVEKLESDERARSKFETGHFRKTHPVYQAADEFQKQNVQQIAGKKVVATDDEKPNASKPLRHAPHLRVDTELGRTVDDGLTVGREAHRSAATAPNEVKNDVTGRSMSTQCKHSCGLSGVSDIRRKAVAADRDEEFPHPVRQADRRYSFSRGDDEVLPVTPSDTGFEEAELRRALEVPTGDSSSATHAGTSRFLLDTFSGGGIPLSTSADSVGSVVWLGGSGNLASSNQLAQQPVHVGGLRADVGDNIRRSDLLVSESVSSPEQAGSPSQVPGLSGNTFHPSFNASSASISRDARGGTGSQCMVYASPTIRPVSDSDTYQMSGSSRRERPASPQAPSSHGALSSIRPAEASPGWESETTGDARHSAAAQAVTSKRRPTDLE